MFHFFLLVEQTEMAANAAQDVNANEGAAQPAWNEARVLDVLKQAIRHTKEKWKDSREYIFCINNFGIKETEVQWTSSKA